MRIERSLHIGASATFWGQLIAVCRKWRNGLYGTHRTGQLGEHARPFPYRALDTQGATERFDTIGQPAEARAETDRRASDTIVDDLDGHSFERRCDADEHVCRSGMLDDVRERLRADVVGRQPRRVVRLVTVHDHLD